MIARKILTIFLYTVVVLLIGRNLSFLPRVGFIAETSAPAERLQTKLQRLTEISKGNYSIYYENMSDPRKKIQIDAHVVHTGASVNKVPIVATLYALASKGKINLDEQITVQLADIQDYGTGSIRYQEDERNYTLRTLAKLALKESDNTAAHVLGKKLGNPLIQQHVDSWGLTQTNMERNKTSVADMALLFKKIYKEEITDSSKTKELLGYMTDTTTEDRLPEGTPDSVIVAHKTGDTVGGMHDIGIVTDGKNSFVLGVMTSDIGAGGDETKKIIAEIAKNVYEFEKSLQ